MDPGFTGRLKQGWNKKTQEWWRDMWTAWLMRRVPVLHRTFIYIFTFSYTDSGCFWKAGGKYFVLISFRSVNYIFSSCLFHLWGVLYERVWMKLTKNINPSHQSKQWLWQWTIRKEKDSQTIPEMSVPCFEVKHCERLWEQTRLEITAGLVCNRFFLFLSAEMMIIIWSLNINSV